MSESNISDEKEIEFRRAPPEVIIKSAIKKSRTIIQRLANDRINTNNKAKVNSINRLYRESHQEYKESVVRGNGDIGLLKKAEPNLFKSFEAMNFIKANSYGYPINKRVHAETEGQVDPLNAAYNIGGSELRDFFVTFYPLPSVSEYDYFEKSQEKLEVDHVGLPSLDLAEVLRPYIQELAFTLFFHNVPINKMNKYFRSFLYESRDWVDWIYGGGRPGINSRKNSNKYIARNGRLPRNLDRKLRDFKLLIRNDYFPVGRNIDPKKMNEYYPKPRYISPKLFLDNQKVEDQYWQYFSTQSVDRILDRRDISGRVNGDKFHKRVSYGIPQPFFIDDVIKNGDKFRYSDDEYLIISELRIGDRSNAKRADFVVFKKMKNGYWKPIVIFDVKTRFGYQWDFMGEPNKYNDLLIKPKYRHRKVELSEEEWNKFGFMKIILNEKKQYNEYAKLMVHNYTSIAHDEEYELLKGIIRVAPPRNSNGWIDYRNTILTMIRSVIADPEINEIDTETVFFDNNCDKKITIVVEPPKYWNYNGDTSLNENHVFNHNKYKNYEKGNGLTKFGKKAEREHILYLYAESPTSAGYSAAWIATYHHLIPHVVKKHQDKRIILIDMMNILSKFKNERLRTSDSVYFEKMINQVEVISWPDFALQREIPELPEGSVSGKNNAIDTENDLDENEKEKGKNIVYIFSGWDLFRSLITPPKIKLIEQEIISKVPNGAISYWIDKCNMAEDTSSNYQMRTIQSLTSTKLAMWSDEEGLYENSQSNDHAEAPNPDIERVDYVTKVIYNLPTAPKHPNHKNPQYEGHRIIIEMDKYGKITEKWQSIIPLRRHSARFYGKKFQSKLNKFRKKSIVKKKMQEIEIQKGFDLLPWIASEKKSSTIPIHYSIEKISKSSAINIDLDLHSKYSNLTYIPTERKPKEDSKLVDKKYINREFNSRSKQRFDYVHKMKTTFPINSTLLVPYFDTDSCDQKEKLRIKSAIKILQSHVINHKYLTAKEEGNLDLLIHELEIAIENNSSGSKIKELIIWWETQSDTNFWNYFKKHRDSAYDQYILDKTGIPKKISNNKDYFLDYGNANYLLLLGLKLIHPALNEMDIEKMWEDLFSYTLQMIGFYPKIPDFLSSNYNVSLIWYHLDRRATSLKKTTKEMNTGVNYRHGHLVTIRRGKSKFIWFYLQNYQPSLIEIKYKGVFGPNEYSYQPINDEDTLDRMKEEVTKNTDQSNQSDPTLITNYQGHDFFWIHRDLHWSLIGKFHFKFEKGINRIEYFRISETNITPPIPEMDPEEISMEDELKHLESIVRPRLYVTFDYYSVNEVIDLNFYDYIKAEKQDFRIDEIEPLFDKYFDNSHLMINYLRKRRLKSVKNNNQFYSLDPINDIEWKGWGAIKSYVQSWGQIDNSIIPSDGRKFWNKFEELLDVETKDLKTINCELKHLLNHCQLEEFSETELLDFVNLMVKNNYNNLKYFTEYLHLNCWTVTIQDHPENLPASILRKFDGEFSGDEIFNLFGDPFISIKNSKTGFHDYYILNLKPEDDETCQEDYWIRRLFRERFGNNLWRRAPGSSKINPTYEVESISDNDGALKVTYYTIATGFRNIKTFPGDKDICKRYIIYETELSILANYLEGQGVNLKKHKDFEYWQKRFVLHRKDDCDNIELHEIADEEKDFIIPTKITLIEKSSKYSLNLFYSKNSVEGFQKIAGSVNEVDIAELISFIVDVLCNTQKDRFGEIIDVEFGKKVSNYEEKHKSRNRSLFTVVAGTVEDLVFDKFGEESKEYLSVNKALERWE